MNITLIQPFTDNIEPPLSLGFLSGVLKQAGHHVRMIDLQIPEIRHQWNELLAEEPVDVVGITAMTPQIKQAHEIAVQIKTALPNVPIIVGGAHPTLLPEQTLREFQAFDMIVIGEGEETIVELLSRLQRKEPIADSSVRGIAYRLNGDVMMTQPRPRILDLDTLPYPHYNYNFDFYLNNNSFGFTEKCVSMIVSRGCPYNCRFCATTNFWTRKYICKSTDGVIKEIRYVLQRGAEGIVFRDSTFNVNKKWVHELCGKILKENLTFKWAMNARVNLVDYESFSIMKKAGLDTVYFGVESGSQKMLDFYGKGITLKQTEKAFEICKKLNIHTGAYFMLGALAETREDMRMTYEFVKRLQPTFSLVFIFMPLPGSELYQHYIDEGYHFDYSDIRSDKAVFASAGFSIGELEAIREKWYHDFNKKPNLFMRGSKAMKEMRSLKDFKKICKKTAKYLIGQTKRAKKGLS
jgi:anaerobic magnesium-protoporphyrin IX monomethyl ester cyclase